MTTYEIRQGRPGDSDYTPYGGALNFIKFKGSEAIVSGPAETGKTLAALWKLHICACKYPDASIVIVRKTLTSTYSTVLVTFQDKVIKGCPAVKVYGGETPRWFNYSNGSKIWVAGMDKSARVLSAEHDIVYFNQAEEATLEDWETLTTRTTGRAGNMPYNQTIGDMNPSYPQHWIYHRKSLKVFYSFHQENPALYNQQTGEITAQGKKTMAVLEALTGVRRIRLLDGKPALAEGAIYDWNDAIHLIDEEQAPKAGLHIAGVDWGFSHPGVMGIFRVDGDGRMFLVKQVYRAGKTVDWWIEQALELQRQFNILWFACDPSEPAYIEQFCQAGLKAVKAFSRVLPGINAVEQRLKVQGDGRPRLFVMRDSLREADPMLKANHKPYMIQHEFPGYVWAGTAKEQPVKEDDHGMDMIRYTVCQLDNIGGEQKREAGVW